MIFDQPLSAAVVQKVAKLPSVNTRGVSHTANGENICLSNARQVVRNQNRKRESFCYRSPKIYAPISRRCELIFALFFVLLFCAKKVAGRK